MAGIGEASLVLGLISSTIAIFDAAHQIYEAAGDAHGLPKKLRVAADQIPLVYNILSLATKNINAKKVPKDALVKAQPILERCKENATTVKDIFDKTIPAKDASRTERLRKAVGIQMKSNKVKEYMEEICKSMELLAQNQVFQDAEALQDIKEAIEQLSSTPDEEEQPQFIKSGPGSQNNQTGSGTQNNISGNQTNISGNQYNVDKQYLAQGQAYTADDIDRACLRNLRCPNSQLVMNRLKENKDKLLDKSIEWIFNDGQYNSWQNGDDVCLLWIKGGAGKGKTMISIGLIKKLWGRPKSVVTYFFCQNADYELNTVAAIIKGLIFQLLRQQEDAKKVLRDKWDSVNERFDEDVTSWRGLWYTFLDMLDCCKSSRVYVIVDALDECQDDGMADLLKLLVRTGLHRPSQIKWLLTSRPLDSAERELLAGADQVRVSLELNSRHVSEAVKTYIAYKAAELDRRNSYGQTLRQKIQTELADKSEDTFLWVSLVCKRLETVHRDQALATIQDLPPGLQPFYRRMLNQVSNGESAVVKGCMRILHVMTLAYRPLHVAEVCSVTGLSDEREAIAALVDRCASYLKMQGSVIEFVHKSAQDFLVGTNGQSALNIGEQYGHAEIVSSILTYLSSRLKVNLVDLPRPDSTRQTMKSLKNPQGDSLVASVDYATTFWVQHLNAAKRTIFIQDALSEQGKVVTFLRTNLLMWLECLSLLDRLPRVIEAFKTLEDMVDSQKNHVLSMLMQDATRFLLRHYQILAAWPLQIYSSAIIFSPQSSIVRMNYLNKAPIWLRTIPRVEEAWTSLIQTLAGHSSSVWSVTFSPDGKQIASGSGDQTIKLWDAATGDLQSTLTGHSGSVWSVAFSPDGKQIASGSGDQTIKLWDAATGDLQSTLTGHSSSVWSVTFSPDGKQIASGSGDQTIKLWDAATGDLQSTLTGHSGSVWSVTFSPDGKQIASGSGDQTIKLWDAATGDLQSTLTGHSGSVWSVAFSPDGKQIASGSGDQTIKLWDAATGDLQSTLTGHSSWVRSVAFSPDGKQIASGSGDQTIKLWDAATGDLQSTLTGHLSWVQSVAFSPDGKQIASGSGDQTIKLWDAATGDLQSTLTGHLSWVQSVAFSPDGKQIASGSVDQTIKLWDAATGDLQSTLTGHLSWVQSVAFSPDGKQIASGSGDQTIKLWDTATGDLQSTLTGHSSWVRSVAFSPDGKQIASGSDDQTIKLWDAATGDLQSTLFGHSGWVLSVAFSPDGKQIASGSWDQTVKLWDVVKSLKASRGFRSNFARLTKFRALQSIKTLEPVHTLKFSGDAQYLATNLGHIKIDRIITKEKGAKFEIFPHLRISGQWICYGAAPMLRLPADFQAKCHDVRDDQLVIGFANGRVLSFELDCRRLHSEFEAGFWQSRANPLTD